VTPACQTSKVGEIGGTLFAVYRRVVIHCRAIILLLILACVAFLVARSDEFGRFELILFALLLMFIASQIFWVGRFVDVGERFTPGRPRRFWLVIMTVVVYLFVCLSVQLSRVGSWSCYPRRRLPAAERAYSRGILVVVRGIHVGVPFGDCFWGGRPGGPRCWVGLPQSAHGNGASHPVIAPV